jgi:hypothetical protein
MSMTFRARSLPYPPARTRVERICTRCGIQFRIAQPNRDAHLTECRDCRGIK